MWKWNGQGFRFGIPARDLTDDEAREIGINRVRDCGLYVHIRDKKPVNTEAKKGDKSWQEQEHLEKPN